MDLDLVPDDAGRSQSMPLITTVLLGETELILLCMLRVPIETTSLETPKITLQKLALRQGTPYLPLKITAI